MKYKLLSILDQIENLPKDYKEKVLLQSNMLDNDLQDLKLDLKTKTDTFYCDDCEEDKII